MKKPLNRKTRKKRVWTRDSIIYLVICVLVFGGFLYTFIVQEKTLSDIRKQQAFYNEEIVIKEGELAEAEERAAHSSPDKFYEDKARDEGYIRDDETQFVVGN